MIIQDTDGSLVLPQEFRSEKQSWFKNTLNNILVFSTFAPLC